MIHSLEWESPCLPGRQNTDIACHLWYVHNTTNSRICWVMPVSKIRTYKQKKRTESVSLGIFFDMLAALGREKTERKKENTYSMQGNPGSIATLCPTVLSATSDPTSMIFPADSCPMTGGALAGSDPQTCASEPQIPVEMTSTSTSLGPTAGTSRCWIWAFCLAVQTTELFCVILAP